MSTPRTAGTEPTKVTHDELDVLLGGLEIDETEDAEIEEIEVGAADDDELRALEVDLTKAEVYEAAKGEKGIVELKPAEKAVKEKKARAPKAAKAAAPKLTRDLSTLSADAFLLKAGGDAAADKKALLAKRPSQKKIAEKFDQTIAALAIGRKPSTYVIDCFKVLDAKKSVTSTDLVAALRAEDYSDGTARSQVGQIMVLFDLLGIAARNKGALELVTESAFADRLRKVL